jgi:hypothetical protein
MTKLSPLTIICAAVVLLSSCEPQHPHYQVVMGNGAVITASDWDERSFRNLDSVCISRVIMPMARQTDWQIDRDGAMTVGTDTLVADFSEKGTPPIMEPVVIEYKIGRIRTHTKVWR